MQVTARLGGARLSTAALARHNGSYPFSGVSDHQTWALIASSVGKVKVDNQVRYRHNAAAEATVISY